MLCCVKLNTKRHQRQNTTFLTCQQGSVVILVLTTTVIIIFIKHFYSTVVSGDHIAGSSSDGVGKSEETD